MELIARPAMTRAARMEDIEAVTAVLNAFPLERFGGPEYTVRSVRSEWESGNLNLEEDTRVAFDDRGRMIAFVEYWDDPNGGVADLAFYLHGIPGEVSAARSRELIAFAESRARKAVSRAESGQRVELSTDAWLENEELCGFLESAGYAPVSYCTRMVMDFDSEPERPVWPEGIAVRSFRRGIDDQAVHAVRQEAWADMRHGHPIPFEMWRYYLIENNPYFDESLWFMAMDGEEIAGICLSSASMAEEPDRGWVFSVGVKRPYRKRGIAGAMLRHAFNALYARGVRKVGLSVDSESLTGANRIYERAGMRAQRKSVRYARAL